LLKTVQTSTTFRNPLADPVGTRRGPRLVRGPQFENRWAISLSSVFTCIGALGTRDGTESRFVTQRPNYPGIQRPGDPVNPVTLFYNELQMSTYV